MGMFKRSKKSDRPGQVFGNPELAALVAQGTDLIGQLGNAHMTWGLGSADRWGLDQTTGLMTWTFPDKTATAPAQLIGSYNPSAGSWMWAWANESILPEMSRDSDLVREWASAHGHPELAEPVIDADDQMAAMLGALALRVTAATGFYRGTGSASIPFITFGAVTLTSHDGTTSNFGIELEIP
ncbi:DUF6882 domain-containing protein [Nocardia sp. NPDC050712]|uniref:DUF6882 domain-containing protein n=1 Tax=Nocardia sp. NPDC050712 TaxID=3155518 RepID=UPI0033C7B69C